MFDLNDPNFEMTAYDPFIAYGQSKTATILFAVEFDRRHKERGIRATAIHPGGIRTELGRHPGYAPLEQMVEAINAERAAKGEPTFSFKTISQGAATTVWAGTVGSADDGCGRSLL